MFLQKLSMHKKRKRGFTLIELAIVLAVTSLLTVGLWRMMASGNTQLRDQAAADQHVDLIKAVKAYLASSEGQTFLPAAAGGKKSLPFSNTDFQKYLPGLTASPTNSYGQTYEIQVKRDSTEAYSFMIKTTGGEAIPDSSGGRVSSLIGGEGGFVYAADLCGNPGARACGAFGSWNALPVGDYAFNGVGGGQVASRTFSGSSEFYSEPWLARIDLPNDGNVGSNGNFNTMQSGVNLSLNGNMLSGTGHATAGSYDGSIEDLLHLSLGANDNDDGPLLEITGTCHSEMNPIPTGCEKVVSITGDVGITGRLEAMALYGARYIYDAQAGQTSDRRLKKDLKPIDNALGKLSQINGYQFTRKDTGEVKYGVIAQDVEKVFPHVVIDIDNGYKGVDYMGLVGPLVAAVQELKLENEKLKEEMEALKKKVK